MAAPAPVHNPPFSTFTNDQVIIMISSLDYAIVTAKAHIAELRAERDQFWYSRFRISGADFDAAMVESGKIEQKMQDVKNMSDDLWAERRLWSAEKRVRCGEDRWLDWRRKT